MLMWNEQSAMWEMYGLPKPRPGRSEYDGEIYAGLLLARLDVDGPCKDPLWARETSLPAPRVLLPAPVSASLRADASKRFRALPAAREASRGVSEDGDAWETADRPPEVRAFADGETRWVSVSHTGGNYCGGVVATLWAVWQVDANGYASLPEGPGLGVEMDEKAMAKVAADPKRRFRWPHPTYADGSVRDY